jgi:hypothetical protein
MGFILIERDDNTDACVIQAAGSNALDNDEQEEEEDEGEKMSYQVFVAAVVPFAFYYCWKG